MRTSAKKPPARPRAVAHKHDHDACVSRALLGAERICVDRGARLTSGRRRVLELIWESHDVVTAYELLEALQREDPKAKPPTVYRALEFLQEHGLVHRIESMNGFTRCEDPGHASFGQFLICTECGSVSELQAPSLVQTLETACRRRGFRAHAHTIEVRGVCSGCAG